MKTVSGKVKSTTPISLSNAAKSLSKFAVSNHEASHAVSLYLQRAADSFNHLVKFHQKLNPNVKVEEISVKNVESPNGSREIQKIKNLGKEENPEDQKFIKVRETVKSKKSEMGFVQIEHFEEISVKNVESPNGSREIKKRKNLGKEENPVADTTDKAGETVKSKKNELEFVKIEHSEEISESRRRNKKNREVGLEVEGVVKNVEENPEADTRKKTKKLIKTEQQLDIDEGEAVKSKKNELEFVTMESELKEVKEEGMTSRDRKKRKKKNRGVGDSEQEVGKVEEDSANKAEEEGAKRKSMDPDAGENAGSTEQRSKKRVKSEELKVKSN